MNVQEPLRVDRSHTQRLCAPAEEVFPLLCPVREADWIEGWEPEVVLTTSGVAEDGCVFVTHDDGRRAVWTVTEHDPPHAIGFVKVESPVVTRIRIDLEGMDEGTTAATVTYTFTALSAEGAPIVHSWTKDRYRGFMEDWEGRLNHYLRTGRRRPDRR